MRMRWLAPRCMGPRAHMQGLSRAPHAVLLPAGQQLRFLQCLQSCAVSPKLYSVWLADPAQHKLLLALLSVACAPTAWLYGCR